METFGSSESLPISSAASGRKRGRPRKYGPNGPISMTPLPLTTAPANPSVQPTPAPPVSATAPMQTSPSSSAQHPNVQKSPSSSAQHPNVQTSPSSSAQHPKVRPPASGTKKRTRTSVERIGIPGSDYEAHAIYAKPGEDVVTIITDHVQKCIKFVHVSSAVGALSSAVLLHSSPNGSRNTYEGMFDIADLKGTFMPTEKDGMHGLKGRLAITLCYPNNELRAGRVAGPLTASTPVQIVVCSFKIDEQEKSEVENHMEPFYAIMNANPMNVGESDRPPADQPMNDSPGHGAADCSNQD